METKQLITRPLFTGLLKTRMFIGAGIALLMISFFVFKAGHGNPAWGAYWMIKPLILTPVLGAVVASCYDLAEPLRRIEGWRGKIFLILSLLGYLIGLWIALILGLNGTMWN